MFDKIVLKEDFIVSGSIPYELTKINYDQLKNIIFESFSKKDRKSKNPTNYFYNHYFLYDDENVLRLEKQLNDYYRHHAKLDLILSNKSCLCIPKDGIINNHQQLDYLNLKDSPDYTCYYFLNNYSPTTHILFEFDNIKEKNKIYPWKVHPKTCVLFNSDLRHSIMANQSDIPIMAIVFQFKIDNI
jgi:hypothetical protein